MAKKLPPRTVPKPMTAKEQAFVKAPTPLVPQSPKGSAQGGRNLVERAGGKHMRRIAAYFTPALAKRLELHCVQTDQDLSDAIVAAVEQYLKTSE